MASDHLTAHDAELLKVPLPEVTALDARTREVLERVVAHYGGVLPVGQQVMLNNPAFWRQWIRMGNQILVGGTLEPRLRELLILRTARNLRNSHEVRSHTPAARAAGLDGREIDCVLGDGAFPEGSSERLLVGLADELHRDGSVSPGTWSALTAANPPDRLMEMMFIVGHYTTTAFVFNSVGLGHDG